MNDAIIEAISAGSIHSGNISFDRLRALAARDHDLWHELGRGRAILSSQEQLNQYLYSYGPMTKSQWGQFLPGVRIPAGRLRIVDYGCGQGLACTLLLDHFGNDVIERIDETVLIEPSTVALARAKSILLCYRQGSRILDLSVKLDEITPAYLKYSSDLRTIHLFSNVLDIDDFDYGSLFTKMFRVKGHHSVLAVSHDRNFQGGSARFHDIESQISDPRCRDKCTVTTSEIVKYNCSNGQPAISWQLHVEVLNGSI
jgi:SAM-dependent methyltransferase